jgi:hypothetical protein
VADNPCFDCCCEAQEPGTKCCPGPCPEPGAICCLPDLCCGRNDDEIVCCEEGEKCCDDTEEYYCCLEAETCCEGVCCPEGIVCCDGVCCAEGECCNDGVCEPCECDTPCLNDDCGACPPNLPVRIFSESVEGCDDEACDPATGDGCCQGCDELAYSDTEDNQPPPGCEWVFEAVQQGGFACAYDLCCPCEDDNPP